MGQSCHNPTPMLPKPLMMFFSSQSVSGYFSANFSPLVGKELTCFVYSRSEAIFLGTKDSRRNLWLYLRNRSAMWLITSTGSTLAQATISCHQDYSSGLLTGLPLPLQSVFSRHSSQNGLWKHKSDCDSPLLKTVISVGIQSRNQKPLYIFQRERIYIIGSWLQGLVTAGSHCHSWAGGTQGKTVLHGTYNQSHWSDCFWNRAAWASKPSCCCC